MDGNTRETLVILNNTRITKYQREAEDQLGAQTREACNRADVVEGSLRE